MIILILSVLGFASDIKSPFPIFMREGFSTILEFEQTPTKVVLGDQSLFQVEKVDKSIVIRPVAAYASTNMFVYFKESAPKLLLLQASEEFEPLYYKKFESMPPKPIKSTPKAFSSLNGLNVTSAKFDSKKDYLIVDFEVGGESAGKIVPNWGLLRLVNADKNIKPSKLWSERNQIEPGTRVKGRAEFIRPGIGSKNFVTKLVLPLKSGSHPLTANLKAVTE